MDLDAVALGLATAAADIVGLTCYEYTPESVTVPAFYVGEITTDFDETMARGMDRLTVVCRLVVQYSDPKSAQRELNAYMSGSGVKSVKAALNAARGAPGDSALPSTLAANGCCDDAVLTRIAGHRLYTIGTAVYLGAEFTITVIGPGES
jgi:hypothetical protein